MDCLYKMRYAITDRGITYPEREEEISVKPGKTKEQALKKHLNKYRHAQCLSTKFTVQLIGYIHVGYECN